MRRAALAPCCQGCCTGPYGLPTGRCGRSTDERPAHAKRKKKKVFERRWLQPARQLLQPARARAPTVYGMSGSLS